MKLKTILLEIQSDEYKKLAKDIDNFIEKYAAISPNYDPKYDDEDEKYTGPDPYELLGCSKFLKSGKKPIKCHSDWGSGAYKPYSSKEGKTIHDSIVDRIYKIINSKG